MPIKAVSTKAKNRGKMSRAFCGVGVDDGCHTGMWGLMMGVIEGGGGQWLMVNCGTMG